METVEVVIRIPKDEYGYMIANPLRYNVCDDEKILYNYIKHGTVLPKGHGRLIDADEFARFLKDVSKWQHYNKLCLDNSLTVADVFDAIYADLKGKSICKFEACPTILEADKEVENG